MNTPRTSQQRLALRGIIFGLVIAVAALALLLTAGCVASGKTWWNPTTWGSDREAKAVDKAATEADAARAATVKRAQITAHETAEALTAAPDSRPVEVARESNGQTVTLLDQAAGPLTVDESTALKKQVADLLSENAEIRAAGEQARAASRADIAVVSAKLTATDGLLSKAQDGLRAGFDRENALGNQLRNERLLKYGGMALSGLLGLAAFAYRMNVGRLQTGAAELITKLETKHGYAVADVARATLDDVLHTGEKTAIGRIVAKINPQVAAAAKVRGS